MLRVPVPPTTVGLSVALTAPPPTVKRPLIVGASPRVSVPPLTVTDAPGLMVSLCPIAAPEEIVGYEVAPVGIVRSSPAAGILLGAVPVPLQPLQFAPLNQLPSVAVVFQLQAASVNVA